MTRCALDSLTPADTRAEARAFLVASGLSLKTLREQRADFARRFGVGTSSCGAVRANRVAIVANIVVVAASLAGAVSAARGGSWEAPAGLGVLALLLTLFRMRDVIGLALKVAWYGYSAKTRALMAFSTAISTVGVFATATLAYFRGSVSAGTVTALLYVTAALSAMKIAALYGELVNPETQLLVAVASAANRATDSRAVRDLKAALVVT